MHFLSLTMANLITKSLKYFKGQQTIYFSRLYSKNVVFRKPIRILKSPNQESVIPPLLEVDGKPSALGLPKINEVSAFIKKPEGNVVPYEKLIKNDGRFTKLLEIIKNRTKREKSGKILLEGKRLINDAILAGMKMKVIYFSNEEDLKDIKLKNLEEIKVYKVLYRTMKIWSDLTTCPGVMAVFRRPGAGDISVLSQPVIPISILCDNIREPGNLGSIIRNAAAAGCENVLLTKGCVDPWEMKVLRSGCGGHFRIPIVNNIEWSQISNYIPSNSTIIVSDNNADIDPVTISSNFISYEEKGETEEEVKYVTFNEDNQPVRIDETFDSRTEVENFGDIQLPCHLYSSIQYPKNHIVLYIGGETHGVDPRIVKLACEYGGKKIKIPLENGMDSFNSVFAMTIILYEIKRQYSQLYVTKK